MKYLSLLALLAISALSFSLSQAARPNIILIMVDDMGWSDIGCYGGEVQTPNLDRLAGEGMRFTQFYNNAKCTTTRASIVTGLWPRRTGDLLKTNMVTLGEVMQDAGYATALSGKWHLGHGETTHPYNRGFQEFYGLLDGCCNFFNPSQPDPEYKGGKTRVFGHNDQGVTSFPSDYYSTDAFTDHAIETITKVVKEDPNRPFFHHITYTAPHYPLHAKPEDIAKYKGKFMMGWDKMREQRYARQVEMGLIDTKRYPLSQGDSRSYAWETADQEFEDNRMAVYAAMVDSVDQNIGRLLQTLKELKVDDNTLICFLSDNGGCAEEPGGRDPNERNAGPGDDYVAVGPAWGWAQNTPFKRYKQWLHEGGSNTPMIAWWPKQIEANTINEQPGHIIDFMATFIDMAGAKYPETYNGKDILPIEGKSMLPVFKGKQRQGHDFYAWAWTGNRAYRVGDMKAVWDKLVKQWELYDLSVDRTENVNLASAHPETTQRLAKAWTKWAKETGLTVKE
ncbi:MAG: arylsulfatase A-like enzyme [Candidatus Pelagisphaera sp.]|jgi:arylsulfatase A-like enzyme